MHPELTRFSANQTPCGRTRREFLWEVGGGFAGLALFDLLSRDRFFDRALQAAPSPTTADLSNPLTPESISWHTLQGGCRAGWLEWQTCRSSHAVALRV
jgi:hypothetical protein